jgi:DNA repair exonuclease SbcCD ATPase subunit
MHRTELDRERTAGDQQKAAVTQLGQQYAEREKASQEQIEKLTGQLEQVKTMPGVDQKAADELEKKIKELGERSVPADRLAELESTIAQIQNSSIADDAEIQELMAQIEQSQKASRELEKTKKQISKDVETTSKNALDMVDQLKQDLRRLQQVSAAVQPAVTDLIPAQLEKINAKIAELGSENEDQYNELLRHDQELQTLGSPGSGGAVMEPETEPLPPTQPTPTPPTPTPGVPDDNDTLANDEQSRAQALAALAKAQILNPDYNKQPEEVAESRFQQAINWAIGKKL